MRLGRSLDTVASPVPVVIIAALNIIFLSVFLFFFHAHFSGPGYGIQAALVPLGISAHGPADGEIIEVIALGEDRVLVNGSAIDLAALQNLLSQLRGCGERSIMIVSGKQVAFDQVVRVWDLCRQNGIKQVYVVTRE